MEVKKIFYYKRENKIGFDKILIVAYTISQSKEVLKETVVNPNEWKYMTWKNIQSIDFFDDDENN